MTKVSLVDSSRLSSLLQEALEWNGDVSSLLVSAQNGSILAYAFRGEVPSVKAMRTRSTTVTTAYAVASQERLVFEAQKTGALTVIARIADHLLLAVTGPEPEGPDPYEKTVHEAAVPGASDDEDGEEDEFEETQNQRIRSELEAVNEELANILRQELLGFKWPDDI